MSARTQVSSLPPAWKRALGALGGFFLGAVLLVAAWAKALDPQAFARQVELEGLDFLLSAPTVALIALGLEVFLGVALVLGVRRWWVLVPVSALVAFFLFLTGRAYYHYTQGVVPEEGCGCFGALLERTPAEAFWQDLLLMVPALLLAWIGRRARRPAPRLRLGLALLLTAATLVFAWKAPELPLDDLATRLRPGAEVAVFCAGSAEEGNRVCLDGLLPELAEGEHLVVLTELGDALGDADVERLNAYLWAGEEPRLWVLSAATPEELFAFKWQRGPAFEVHEAPPALLRPLYRTLPRSFLVRGGVVAETYPGLPPQLGAADPAARDADDAPGVV